MEIKINEIPAELKKDPAKILEGTLGFGQIFCDRMFKTTYTPEKSWHDAHIGAYEPIVLDPAALVLHYAQEIFEGLKAYKQNDGTVAMFRPEMNAQRFNNSAKRLVMPEVPVEDQLKAFEMLVKELVDWIPTKEGYSLYIRPTMIATTPILGVQPSKEYLFYVICSPVAGYFAGGFKPVSITTSEEFVRAAVGGIGAAKTGGNYAASLMAAKVAKEQGFDQVVWLDANHHRYIEEMGGMNIMFVKGKKIFTCPLTGSILPGITRNSVFTLAPELGYSIEETMLDADQICKEIDSGEISEIFACGTAAVITAVGNFSHKGVNHQVADGQPGDVSKNLYNTLTGIQRGEIADKHGWVHRIEI